MIEFAQKVANAPLGKVHLFSVGQAGFIVKSKEGRLLGIDLYLSDCVERVEGHVGYKRLLPKLLAADELVFDAVIATHPHRDHFDEDAIPLLMQNGITRLFASAHCQADIARLGLAESRTECIKPGDRRNVGPFTIDFTACDHGKAAPDAVGVVVQADGIRIYETGDTCLRLDTAGEIRKTGKLDILIAPINGMYGNMDARQCAVLANKLKPELVIPCHYGMFASHMGSIGEFFHIMTEEYPNQPFLIMAQGEQCQIQPI